MVRDYRAFAPCYSLKQSVRISQGPWASRLYNRIWSFPISLDGLKMITMQFTAGDDVTGTLMLIYA